MGWRLFVSTRYLTRRKRERFISIIGLISIFGVTIGVAALIVVISIMTGFDTEIKEKIIGTYSHIVLLKEGGIEDEEEIMELLNGTEHVIASSPFIDMPAFLKYRDGVVGILLRGLDEKREGSVSNVKEYVDPGRLDFGRDGVILGKELAETLRLKKGDSITLLSPDGRRRRPSRIIGTFTSGRYDYDANLVFASLETAKKPSRWQGRHPRICCS